MFPPAALRVRMLGNFYELGPVKLSDQGELVPRARRGGSGASVVRCGEMW